MQPQPLSSTFFPRALAVGLLTAILTTAVAISPSSAHAEEWKAPTTGPLKPRWQRRAAIADGFILGGLIVGGVGANMAFFGLAAGLGGVDIETLEPWFIASGVVTGAGLATTIVALAVKHGVTPHPEYDASTFDPMPRVAFSLTPRHGSVVLGWSF
ncbi:MAG: hypothetical protein U0414_38720 [Polyangiaceae bacterium]